jgi:hypothetical protein
VSDHSKQIEEIEATQKQLRESIEQSKRWAEKADNLLQKHKQTLQDNEPSSATGSPWD